jgi:ABC-type phosphate transport system auxiliary subunit
MDRYQACKGLLAKSMEKNREALYFKKCVEVLQEGLEERVDARVAPELRKLQRRIERFERNNVALQTEIREETILLNRVRLI